MNVNWDSIISKAKAHMDTPKRKKEMEDKTHEIMMGSIENGSPNGWWSVEETGYKFADVLYRTIERAGLPPRVAERLQNAIQVSQPYYLNRGHKYMIRVYFADDLERFTMSTHKAYYPVNLARLYNDGVDHVMPQIWETDEQGNVSTSNTTIPATYFMEIAVDDFGGNYASDCHVIEINVYNN